MKRWIVFFISAALIICSSCSNGITQETITESDSATETQTESKAITDTTAPTTEAPDGRRAMMQYNDNYFIMEGREAIEGLPEYAKFIGVIETITRHKTIDSLENDLDMTSIGENLLGWEVYEDTENEKILYVYNEEEDKYYIFNYMITW